MTRDDTERAQIEKAIRALGAKIGLDGNGVDEALEGATPGWPMLARASEPMAYAADALRRLGELLLDADREVDGDAFLVNLMSGEPHRGRGTQLDECEDPDSVREVLQHGIPVATSEDGSLLVWNRGDRVEVWETSPHGRPVVHASVLAWFTRAAEALHVVD